MKSKHKAHLSLPAQFAFDAGYWAGARWTWMLAARTGPENLKSIHVALARSANWHYLKFMRHGLQSQRRLDGIPRSIPKLRLLP